MQKFSFPKMQNRQLVFSPEKPYDLVAERSEAAVSTLQFPIGIMSTIQNCGPKENRAPTSAMRMPRNTILL